ncbi:MAG TPA: IS256 family transposase [candidate division WOR-3 bacterium]|uniref:Mutator family transposase n=1 Tax=candidate division WOR-3 bacterium TaxID=2052148 RepID=A0A7V0XEW7_UNCW3|nr:IS256 family transposase [candidate division WOR-3 bacterium]
MEDRPIPEPYYLHLSQKDYIERWQEFKDFFQDDEMEAVYRPMRNSLRLFLQGLMEAERTALVCAQPYKRAKRRSGQRNGYYRRNLLTAFGMIRELLVPRLRSGGFRTKVFERYRRRLRAADNYIRALFLGGASTREVGELLDRLWGVRLSASAVSNIVQLLDEEVRKFHRRPLTDEYRVLMLDGVWVKVSGYKVVKKAVLVAYGIRFDGRREVIDFRVAQSESEAEWTAFLEDLSRRGVKGERLDLVTVDGGGGVNAAQTVVYPHVARQRCWVHKLRNVMQKVPAKHRQTCLGGARSIYQAPNYRTAAQRCRRWAKQWRELAPKAVACLEGDIEDLLAHMRVLSKEPELWKRVRTTNAIERQFRELRKRTRPMCTFANNESCDRIVCALFQKANRQWEVRWQSGRRTKSRTKRRVA